VAGVTSPLVRARWAAYTVWHARREPSLPFYPLERLEAIQARRVRAIVRHAYESVPFYREAMDERRLQPRDIRSAGDLERLPLVTGRELAADPERFASRRYSDRPTLELTTTGTVGVLKRVRFDHAGLFAVFAAGQRQRQVLRGILGRAVGFSVVTVAPEHGTGKLMAEFWASHGWVPRAVDLRRRVVSPADPFSHIVEVINDFEPDVVGGFGAAIGAIFRRAWLENLPIHRPKAIVYGGDLLRQPDRELLERHYGVPVLSSYQAVEAPRIAFQCERREGHHISLDQVAVRVVDEAGATLPPGTTGRIVISNLVNRATVLLNYVLGDLVTMARAPCPCGRGLPVLEGIDGRTDDLLVAQDGELVHESTVLPRLYDVAGVSMLQVIQESPTEFSIKVLAAPGADWQRTSHGLRQALVSLVGGGDRLEITVEQVEDLVCDAGGKYRAVVRRFAAPAAAERDAPHPCHCEERP